MTVMGVAMPARRRVDDHPAHRIDGGGRGVV
jgi:hypothetical protein